MVVQDGVMEGRAVEVVAGLTVALATREELLDHLHVALRRRDHQWRHAIVVGDRLVG